MRKAPLKLAAIAALIAPLCAASIAGAQTTGASQWAEPAIADNSFLVEEAYNQEPGVVQHISTLTRIGGDYAYGLTQEWPFMSQAHQVSYTLPLMFLEGGGNRGVGDIMFNYRYQVPGLGSRTAMSPRVSLIVPTGDASRELGAGATGVQFNLPVSVRLTPAIAAHVNAGATVTPSMPGVLASGDTVHRRVTTLTAAGSIIAPVTMPVNAVLEYVVNGAGSIREDGSVARETGMILNPGVRFAIDVAGAQLVPGVSVGFDPRHPGAPKTVLAYFSIEHAFTRAGAK